TQSYIGFVSLASVLLWLPFVHDAYCIAEAIAVGVSMATAAGWNADDRAEIAFRWTAFEGRNIQGWANPVRSIGLG
ncbi:hypothetical protein ACFX59_18435, partial [Sphingomonas sp. NCPPB 2930]|uniref:hypothetical protein n=1 Tax=Sphingomonas sp. NCPPB 2930 TaxID=3162788 RepID=UPI0036DA3313